MKLTSLTQIKPNAKLCLYGAGHGGFLFVEFIQQFRKDVEIVYYVDDKITGHVNGVKIIDRHDMALKRKEFDNIVITSAYWNEIEQKLIDLSITDYMIADTTNLAETLEDAPLDIKYAKDLELVIVVFNYRCNLRCRHCWNFNNIASIPKENVQAELPASYWKQVFSKSKLLRKKRLIVALEGGEIFLRKDYFELIDFFSSLDYFHRLSLITNGTYPEKIEHVMKHTDIAKKAWFMISIDGEKETHNKIRGDNSYDKALKTINILKSYGCKVSIGTVVQRENINELELIKNRFKDISDGHSFSMESTGDGYIDFSNLEIEYLSSYLREDMINILKNGANANSCLNIRFLDY